MPLIWLALPFIVCSAAVLVVCGLLYWHRRDMTTAALFPELANKPPEGKL